MSFAELLIELDRLSEDEKRQIIEHLAQNLEQEAAQPVAAPTFEF